MLAGLRARERFGFRRFLLSTASRLNGASACRGFVLAHRCGAAPGFHRVPFSFSEKTQRTSTGGSVLRRSIFVNNDILVGHRIRLANLGPIYKKIGPADQFERAG